MTASRRFFCLLFAVVLSILCGTALAFEETGITAMDMDTVLSIELFQFLGNESIEYLDFMRGSDVYGMLIYDALGKKYGEKETFFQSAIFQEKTYDVQSQRYLSSEFTPDEFLQTAISYWVEEAQKAGQYLPYELVNMEIHSRLEQMGGWRIDPIADEYISGKVTGRAEWEILPVEITLISSEAVFETYIFYRRTHIDEIGQKTQWLWCITDQSQVERLRQTIKHYFQHSGNYHFEV